MSAKYKSREETLAQINELLPVPVSLLTDDGRELRIVKWSPVAEYGCFVRVTVEAIVSPPKKDPAP